jgi:hypothetical protein
MIHETSPLDGFDGLIAGLATVALLLGGATGSLAQSCPDAAALTDGFRGAMAHVRFLADDELEGRAVATASERCAGDYLAARFREIGLEPGGPDGTYFHVFPVRTGGELGPDNVLTLGDDALSLHADWAPHGFSASAAVRGGLVYGAHGVSRPRHPDDAFATAEVRGRLLVVEAGDPDSSGGRSIRADPYFKATVAARRGAAALLILDPDGALPRVAEEDREVLPIPVASVAGAAAERIRAAALAGMDVSVRTDVLPVATAARNVVARLPGEDARLAAEHVIIGAHYDHLGMGEGGSAVHNGADDNASGTAALIEIARALAAGPRPDRSVLFIAFTGEEQGLWGSARFVEDPTIELARTIAMLNLDMVGRLDGGPLTVFGTGTAREWPGLLSAANDSLASPLDIVSVPSGSGPSDHASFHAAGIPVLHFFTDTHADYHRPGDDWDRIDADGLDRVIELAVGIASRLARVRMPLTPG